MQSVYFGCYPYEEFSVETLTKTCKNTHSQSLREEYATTQKCLFEMEVFETIKI